MNFLPNLPRLALICIIAVSASAISFGADPGKMPEAGKRLKQAYLESLDAAVRPLRERYLAELKKLQAQATKAGKLDEALALKQEVECILAANLIGTWDSDGGRLQIISDHTATYSNGNTATWDVQGDFLVLKWRTGNILYRYSILDTDDTVSGGRKSIDPGDKWHSIQAKRVR